MIPARTLKSQIKFTGPVFSVRRDLVLEPGGIRAYRDVVTHPGSVVVLPVFPGKRIMLVRQYRHSIGRSLYELVAGRKDPGESPVAAARRELLEETGYAARRLRRLFLAYPTPGFVAESFILYAAYGLARPKIMSAHADADENITTRLFSLPQLLRMIRGNRLYDLKSIAGILYFSRFCV